MRQVKRRYHGAERQCRLQDAQPGGAGVQDVFGVNRQQRRRSAKQYGKQIQRDRAEDNLGLINEFESCEQARERHFRSWNDGLPAAHEGDQGQTNQRRHGIDGVNHRCLVRECNQGAAGGRAKHG